MHFSVVIPLYNKENHIKRAIYSVLNQTYQNFELIVINDGSTDRSVEKVKEFSDSRIKLVEQKNKGVSAARNLGIKLSKNNYIAFLDADDAWEPCFLQVIKELIEKYPDAGAYCTSYKFVKNNKSVLIRKVFNDQPNTKDGLIDYFKKSLKNPVITASSVVIPKKVFLDLGCFPEGIKRGEDQDMWIRIALKYPVAASNEICSIYYLNTENRSIHYKYDGTESLASYAEQILIKEKNKGNNSVYFEEYMIRKIIIYAIYLIKDNQKVEARKLLKKYKYTKFNRILWVKTYLYSIDIVRRIYNLLK